MAPDDSGHDHTVIPADLLIAAVAVAIPVVVVVVVVLGRNSRR